MLQPVTYVWPMTAGSIIGADAWYMALTSSGALVTISGIPPLDFTSKGKPLVSYSIAGNTVQDGTPTPEQPVEVKMVGDRTGNLWTSTVTDATSGNTHYTFDKNTQIASIQSNSSVVGFSKSIYKLNTPIPSKTDLTISIFITRGLVTDAKGSSIEIGGYHVGAPNSWQCSAIISSGSKEGDVITKTIKTTDTLTDLQVFVYTGVVCDFSFKIMLNSGTEPLPYEPYGYKIPITCGEQTKTVYLPTPLAKGEVLRSDGTITRADGTIENFDAPTLETITGTNILTIDTEVQPEDVTITGKGIEPIGGFELTTGDGQPILTGDGEPLTTKG